MTTKLKTLIHDVQNLSTDEQLELLHVISISLESRKKTGEGPPENTDFWNPKSLAEIVQAQQSPVIETLNELAGDFWPEDESVDEFIDYIYKQRQEDRWKA
jgi:hypothetical protein